MYSVLLKGIVVAFLVVSSEGMADGNSLVINENQGEGRAVYEAYCAGCHGLSGQGQTDWTRKNQQGELPAPPHGPGGHTWKHSDRMLYNLVAEGWRDPWNDTEHKTMPAFQNVLTPSEIRSVVNYLKTLWTPEQRQHQEEESLDARFP